MVTLNIGGRNLKCFIDTGSAATLIKSNVMDSLFCHSRGRRARQLIGVSGTLLDTVEERDITVSVSQKAKVQHRFIVVRNCPFPGDALIGIDYLRRFEFTLNHRFQPGKSYLHLCNVSLPVTFTDTQSLRVATLKVKSAVDDCTNVKGLFMRPSTPCARVTRKTILPPCSGRFVLASVNQVANGSDVVIDGKLGEFVVPRSVVKVKDKRVRVWVVNCSHKHLKLHNGRVLSDIEEISDYDQVASATPTEALGETSSPTEHPLPSLDHLSRTKRDKLKTILQSYKSLFDGRKTDVGTVPGIYHSIPTGDATPICTRQWRLPQKAKEIIKEECQKMLQSKVIEPSTSPWMSPIVLVKKKDGSYRFCADFRNLNHVTTSDVYPLPRLEELIDDLGPSCVFSVLDARSAYWSIELNPADKPKTAFSDGRNLWQFTRMPYGLKTAGATYQRMINFVLSPVLGRHTLAYLDDIVIYSNNFEEHLQHLEETLDILSKAGFKMNLDKCDLAVNKLKLLGFIVSANGVAPDPDKVKAISEMSPPRNVKEVRRFLGASGFFRRHVKDYATIAAPLTSLTRKDQQFKWTESHDKAFDELKQALVTAPVLRRPDFEAPFEVHTDASGVALGACLIQRIEGQPHAVAYFSRKLKGAEVRYSATDTEALAVIEGVRAFNAYVYGRKFEVFTDHRPLTYIFKRPTRSAKMSRWSHELASYDCKVTYKQGAVHHMPDLLSRAVTAIDLATVDPEQFRTLQLEDPMCRDLINFLESKSVPRVKIPAALDEFELREGVVYHVRELPSGLISQLVLPPKVRSAAMKIVHSSSTAGHPGVFRTFKRLKDFYWFPNSLNFCRKFVQSCPTCQRRKAVLRGRAPLAAAPLATHPFERVSVDLIDLPPASNGDRYVLTIIDELTRFVQLVPLPTKDTHTVADALISNYTTLFGPPVTLISDNGSEFTGTYFKEVCELMGIKTKYTTPYNPASNGMVERANRVIKDCLSSLCQNEPRTWNTRLNYVRLALNTAFHRSVNNQPLFLLTGRSCTFPIGMTNHHTRDGELGKRQRDLLAARDAAVTGTQLVRESNMENVDRATRAIPELTVGSLVLRRRPPGQGGAGLAPRWLGPLRIIKKTGPVSYIVFDLAKFTEHRVHRNQIIPFKISDDLELITPDGVDEPTPDDLEPDPDDPLNVLLLGLVRSPADELQNQ